MSAARVGFPVVVAAPSGTGKTTVCRRVVEQDPDIVFSVSHTTRPIRNGEQDGHDYHFVDADRFVTMDAEGAFLEWAEYNGNRYGTSWASIDAPLGEGHDVLLEIEVQGASQVREKREDARFIFLLPPSLAELRRRLEGRGTDAPEVIASRLELARRELEDGPRFDYAVVNDDLGACVDTVLEILTAERAGRTAALRAAHAPEPAVRRLLDA
ncbi:MAG: guanylate kinase [Myxococcota bacterium]